MRAAVALSMAAACASCGGDTKQQNTANTTANTAANTATTAPTPSSTTGSPSTTTGTTATTETTASASSVSTTTSTTSSSASSSTGGTSGTTSGTTGVGGSAGDNGDSSTATSNGSGGTSTGSTTTGGTTTRGILVLEDECSHEPCGGALPNTAWRHTRACVQKDQIIGPIQDFCPSVTLVGSSGVLAGSISFTDDTYNQDVIFGLSIELDVPAECDVNCASFGSTLAILGFPDATCTESGDVCHCVGSASGTDHRSGDYATSDDGTLTFVFPYGGIDTTYCVGDGSLSYLIPVMLVPQGSPMDVIYEAVPQ